MEIPRSHPTEHTKFTMGEILGKGGTGTVYSAVMKETIRDLPPGSQVAVKVIKPDLLQSPVVIGRLKREVEIGFRVRSENVVAIYGIEKIKVFGHSTLAIIMELIEGMSLKAILRDTGILSEAEILAVARQTALGSKAIHSLGIVHRDIKPANLIRTKENRVVLTDLGIARLSDISARVTATGAFIGTCLYASPEQFSSSEKLDPRSDLYSLGVVMYELGTGINPYRGKNLLATVQAHLTGMKKSPRSLNPSLSVPLNQLILDLLEKDVDQRIPSADELLVRIAEMDVSTSATQEIPTVKD